MPGIAETDAFARLKWDWDSAYDFTRDSDPGNPEPYAAARRDGRGTLTAADPETLRDKVLRDYLARRVPPGDRAVTGADWVSPAQAAQELREQFPGWTVRAVHGRYEIRIEAHNSDAPGGLYSVTGAYGEVRAELKAARLRALRAAS